MSVLFGCQSEPSKFASFAKSNPRPCNAEACGRGTATMRVWHVNYPGKFDTTVASNHHMTLVNAFAEFTTETLTGDITNPVSLTFSLH